MDDLIAGAENLIDDRQQAGEKTGGTYRLPDAPWRMVWHTTEAVPSTVDGARSMAINHDNPPHLWAWFAEDWVGQTVPLSRSAYALLHKTAVETNSAHAIQCEVIGLASKDPLNQPAVADWMGERVLGPILDAGVPINVDIVAPSGGQNEVTRMTAKAWLEFNGQCGHANVPDNFHWDPGRADYARIGRAAKGEDSFFMTEDDKTIMRNIIRQEFYGDSGAHTEGLTPIIRKEVQAIIEEMLTTSNSVARVKLRELAKLGAGDAAPAIADAVVDALP